MILTWLRLHLILSQRRNDPEGFTELQTWLISKGVTNLHACMIFIPFTIDKVDVIAVITLGAI